MVPRRVVWVAAVGDGIVERSRSNNNGLHVCGGAPTVVVFVVCVLVMCMDCQWCHCRRRHCMISVVVSILFLAVVHFVLFIGRFQRVVRQCFLFCVICLSISCLLVVLPRVISSLFHLVLESVFAFWSSTATVLVCCRRYLSTKVVAVVGHVWPQKKRKTVDGNGGVGEGQGKETVCVPIRCSVYCPFAHLFIGVARVCHFVNRLLSWSSCVCPRRAVFGRWLAALAASFRWILKTRSAQPTFLDCCVFRVGVHSVVRFFGVAGGLPWRSRHLLCFWWVAAFGVFQLRVLPRLVEEFPTSSMDCASVCAPARLRVTCHLCRRSIATHLLAHRRIWILPVLFPAASSYACCLASCVIASCFGRGYSIV